MNSPGSPAKSVEGKSFPVMNHLLFRVYRFSRLTVRQLIRKMVLKLEHGELFSNTIRRIFSSYHGVDVGMYSAGGCFVIGNINPFTGIGRYCSVAYTARTFNADHPRNLISSHALFYNPVLGYASRDLLTRTRLSIGNDVWMGHNSIVLSTCAEIGDGAVIGAGAVVNRNVPPYGIAVGNPARVVGFRFSRETIDKLIESQWWNKPLQDLVLKFDQFQKPLEGAEIR
jgi:virginiamycin A acetyltransferase